MMFDSDKILNSTIVATIVGSGAWVWRKLNGCHTEINNLKVAMAENYATKQEIREVENKIDHQNEMLNLKIDAIGQNLFLLVKDRVVVKEEENGSR